MKLNAPSENHGKTTLSSQQLKNHANQKHTTQVIYQIPAKQ